MASPIPFISVNTSTKKFEVNLQAVSLLTGLRDPVAVLAVCGRARQGKSWLLNQLLAKLDKAGTKGFEVGPTQRPCTKGLWLWSHPIPRTTPKGLKYNLVFLDCEGIDAFDQSKDYSTQVFSLGVLLSSMLIYNQLGSIDESSVEGLSTVCEFAKLIRQKSSSSGDREVSDMSPAFLWLLRDFHLQLQEAGRQVTPKDYMEEVLQSKGHAGKDQMRSSIREVFPDRDCAVLVRPLNDEKALANMATTPLSQLRPEFRQGLEQLVNTVIARAQPKSYHGVYLTGSAFVAFAKAYVGVINKGEVPSLASTWQAVLSTENQKALDAAVSQYSAALDAAASAAGGSVEELDVRHEAALAAALDTLDAQSMGDQAEKSAYAAKLRQAALDRFKPLRAARLAMAEAAASQLLAAGAVRLAPIFSADPPNFDKLDKELTSLLDDYDKKSVGPTKYKLAAEFLVNTVVSGTAQLARRSQIALVAAKERLVVLEKETAQLKEQLTVATQKLGSTQHDETILKTKLAAAEAALTSAREAAEQRARDLAAARDTADQRSRELSIARDTAEQRGRELTTARDAAERRAQELSAEQAKQATQTALVQQLRVEVESLRSQLAAKGAEVAAAQKQVQGEGAALSQARAELADRNAQIARLQTQLSESQTAAARAGEASHQSLAAAQRAAEQQVAASKAAQQAAEAALEGARREVGALQLQVSGLNGEVQAVNGRCRAAESRAAELGEQVTRLEAQLQVAQQQTATAQHQAALAEQQAAAAAVAAATAPKETVVAVVTSAINQDDVDMGDVEEAGPSRGRKRQRAVRAAGDAAAGAGGTTPAPARAGAGAEDGADDTPFSHEKVVISGKHGTTPGNKTPTTGKAASKAAGSDAHGFTSMTVNELKGWLTDAGHEAAVHQLANQRPAPKKDDWVALARSKAT